jgi:hypothetical protein
MCYENINEIPTIIINVICQKDKSTYTPSQFGKIYIINKSPES